MPSAIQKAIRKARRELRAPSLEKLFFTVPLVPPSVNHYKRPKANGRGFFVTDEARAFKAAVASLSKGSVAAKEYFVGVVVYFAKGQRGDAGNLEKCIGDGLQEAGIIGNDSQIKKFQIEVSRDWDEPRTEICVMALGMAPSYSMVRRYRTQIAATGIHGRSGFSGQVAVGPCACHGAMVCRQRGDAA